MLVDKNSYFIDEHKKRLVIKEALTFLILFESIRRMYFYH